MTWTLRGLSFPVIVFGPKETPLIKQEFDAINNMQILAQNSFLRNYRPYRPGVSLVLGENREKTSQKSKIQIQLGLDLVDKEVKTLAVDLSYIII